MLATGPTEVIALSLLNFGSQTQTNAAAADLSLTF